MAGGGMGYTTVLGTVAERIEGSNPSRPTKIKTYKPSEVYRVSEETFNKGKACV